MAAWTALLVFTFAYFRSYNRVPKSTRVWLFPLLHLLRGGAVVAVAPVTVAGALLIAAHALARWMPYIAANLLKARWVNGPMFLLRLWMYGILLAALYAGGAGEQLMDLSLPLIVLWLVYRARFDAAGMLQSVRRLDRPD